jgi:hypothetical protein
VRSAKFVPSAEWPKVEKCSICKDIQNQAKRDTNIISMFITGDEIWVYDYDPDALVSQRLELNQ